MCAVAGKHSFSIWLLAAGPAYRDAGLQAGPGYDCALDGGDAHVPAEDWWAMGLLQVISGVVLLRQGGLLTLEDRDNKCNGGQVNSIKLSLQQKQSFIFSFQ